MTKQTKGALALALALAFSGPALAQDDKNAGGGDKCMGGASGEKCGGGAAGKDELDVRVQFDKEGAKGEIKCKKGKLKGGKVEFEKCLQDKLDKYEDVAVEKKIVASKEKLSKLDMKKKTLAKKLAFYESAVKELKSQLKEMGEAKKDDIEYKKKEGALKKIDKEFEKSLSECAKEDKDVFKCPVKD